MVDRKAAILRQYNITLWEDLFKIILQASITKYGIEGYNLDMVRSETDKVLLKMLDDE